MPLRHGEVTVLFCSSVFGRGGEADAVVQRVDDGVVGDGDVVDDADVLAVAAVADVHRRLALAVAVAAGAHDDVAVDGGGEQVAAVDAEAAGAQADVAGGVGDVVELDVLVAAAVDADALAAPRRDDRVVRHRDVRHRRVERLVAVAVGVVVDRVDGHAVVAGAADEVVRRGQVVADGVVQRHVVEVDAVGPDRGQAAVLDRAAGARGPEAGLDVLAPDVVGDPVGAGWCPSRRRRRRPSRGWWSWSRGGSSAPCTRSARTARPAGCCSAAGPSR